MSKQITGAARAGISLTEVQPERGNTEEQAYAVIRGVIVALTRNTAEAEHNLTQVRFAELRKRLAGQHELITRLDAALEYLNPTRRPTQQEDTHDRPGTGYPV